MHVLCCVSNDRRKEMSGVRNAFNCSFVACRSNLRKCWHFILCYKPQLLSSSSTTTNEHQYQVLCLGLSGSGKSTLLAQLVGEQIGVDTIEPTEGFNIKTLPLNGIMLSIKELGGSERLQTFWSNYYENKHALLFIVNIASNETIMQQSLDTLRTILMNPGLRGRPCMIIGTHKDRPEARTEQQIEQYFQPLLNGHKWKIFCCSALDRKSIMDAFAALIVLIKNVFP
ncbi:ADP-ribosylation factor-like protein 15 [Dermatophagoides farinae]|uniref:ADP-ribosylation factor-like protein 15 n=2 Tax=Dermatophagoides farinae TaxID=6954 RepID=A0A922HVH5_DERFA|nr:ADP-ribosylation factor-like protein 15 [Dermatophagoides farinae]KAH9506984.1 ADP-ribosylation factor-like protein 15 [Dermatophagoides farinae]